MTGADLRPSADRFGTPPGRTVACVACGHASLEHPPDSAALAELYAGTEDADSLAEEEGRRETAHRDLTAIERHCQGDRLLLDVGAWTGTFVEVARHRGWEAAGIEPSAWASARARSRGLDVRTADLHHHGLEPGAYDVVALRDVLEHLVEPRRALDEVHRLLAPKGALYITVPDAGSVTARVLGRRWWSVLPMHVQYFTRASLRSMLEAQDYRIVEMTRHRKAYSVGYFVDRLRGYSPAMSRLAMGAARGIGVASRRVAPSFGDRLQVVAVKR